MNSSGMWILFRFFLCDQFVSFRLESDLILSQQQFISFYRKQHIIPAVQCTTHKSSLYWSCVRPVLVFVFGLTLNTAANIYFPFGMSSHVCTRFQTLNLTYVLVYHFLGCDWCFAVDSLKCFNYISEGSILFYVSFQ